MSDIDIDALERMAGSGPELDTEYQYPPHKWAAQPGNMPSAGQLIDRLHTAEARVSVLESQLAAATQRAEAAEAKLAEVPWEDLGATIVCAQHWTPKGPDGLNFREDHAAFARLDAWLEANGPELPSTTIEPKDELE